MELLALVGANSEFKLLLDVGGELVQTMLLQPTLHMRTVEFASRHLDEVRLADAQLKLGTPLKVHQRDGDPM